MFFGQKALHFKKVAGGQPWDSYRTVVRLIGNDQNVSLYRCEDPCAASKAQLKSAVVQAGKWPAVAG